MPPSYEEFDLGDWIDVYLNHQQRSGSWLARQLGRDPATITRWRSGESKPQRFEDVLQLAAVLGITELEARAAFFRKVLGPTDLREIPLRNDAPDLAPTPSVPPLGASVPESVPAAPDEIAPEIALVRPHLWTSRVPFLAGILLLGLLLVLVALRFLAGGLTPPKTASLLAGPHKLGEVAGWVLEVARSDGDVLLATQRLYDTSYLLDPADWNTDYDVTGDNRPDWILSVAYPLGVECDLFLVVDPATDRLLYHNRLVVADSTFLSSLQVMDVTGDGIVELVPIWQSCKMPDAPKVLAILSYRNDQLRAPVRLPLGVMPPQDWMSFYQDAHSIEVSARNDGATVFEIRLPYQVHDLYGPRLPSTSRFVFRDNIYIEENETFIPLLSGRFQTSPAGSASATAIPTSAIGYLQLHRANDLLARGDYQAAQVLYGFLFRGIGPEGTPLVGTGWKHESHAEVHTVRLFAGVRYILSLYLVAPRPERIQADPFVAEFTTEFADTRFTVPLQAMVTAFARRASTQEACQAFREALTEEDITYPLNDMGKNSPLVASDLCPY